MTVEFLVFKNANGTVEEFDVAQVRDSGWKWGARELDQSRFYLIKNIPGTYEEWKWVTDRQYVEPQDFIKGALRKIPHIAHHVQRFADRQKVHRNRYQINPNTMKIRDKTDGLEINLT